jgi:hypothetical protein
VPPQAGRPRGWRRPSPSSSGPLGPRRRASAPRSRKRTCRSRTSPTRPTRSSRH